MNVFFSSNTSIMFHRNTVIEMYLVPLSLSLFAWQKNSFKFTKFKFPDLLFSIVSMVFIKLLDKHAKCIYIV